MPEGPECRHLTDILHQTIKHKDLESITILSGRYQRHGPPKGFDVIQDQLKQNPIKVIEIKVKGKFIYWKLERGLYLWNTLGMSGQWTTNKDKHCHVEFLFTDRSRFYFRDIRNFGTLRFETEITKKLSTLGHDILEHPLSNEEIVSLFRKRNTWCLPKFLMHQGYLSGVGNYLKCEALYASRLSPFRTIESLTDSEIITLYQELGRIAKESYHSKGASFLTFRDPDSNKGRYSFNFQVYGQKMVDRYQVVREVTGDKRSTYWVKELQL